MSIQFKMFPFPIKKCPVEVFTRATPSSSLVRNKNESVVIPVAECLATKEGRRQSNIGGGVNRSKIIEGGANQ